MDRTAAAGGGHMSIKPNVPGHARIARFIALCAIAGILTIAGVTLYTVWNRTAEPTTTAEPRDPQ